MSDRDDELADFGGFADVAIVATSVAMHVAALALLQRSARRLRNRSAVRAAAGIVASRLSRRGDAVLARRFERALAKLGSAQFDAPLAAAAQVVSDRLRAIPIGQLRACLGAAGADEVLGLGPRACLTGGVLAAADVAALAKHLGDGGELVVGIGHGGVFARTELPEHAVLAVELDHVFDPERTSSVVARHVERRGLRSAGAATLRMRMHAGPTALSISREGRRLDGGALVLDGVRARLRVTVRGSDLFVEPLPQDLGVQAAQDAQTRWAALRAEIQRDSLLEELVAELYTHGNFGGPSDVLAALLELAPLAHRHPELARQLAAAAPAVISDPMSEVVDAMRAALEAADRLPARRR